jgi:hypothetical protein
MFLDISQKKINLEKEDLYAICSLSLFIDFKIGISIDDFSIIK